MAGYKFVDINDKKLKDKFPKDNPDNPGYAFDKIERKSSTQKNPFKQNLDPMPIDNNDIFNDNNNYNYNNNDIFNSNNNFNNNDLLNNNNNFTPILNDNRRNKLGDPIPENNINEIEEDSS